MNFKESEFTLLVFRINQCARQALADFEANVISNTANFIDAYGGSEYQLYISQIRQLATVTVESSVSTVIATCREIDKFPDDDDVNTLTDLIKPTVLNKIDLFEKYILDPFGKNIPASVVEATRRSLPQDLQRIFASGLIPLQEFLLQGRVDNERKSASEVVKKERDVLLPTLSRRQFDSDLERSVEAAVRDNMPLSLIVLDIDKFKSVNDTHGHQVGDEILISVSSIVRDVVRTRGRVYRYGGEELVIILENHVGGEASLLAERLRLEISRSPLSEKQLTITASFGIASMPDHAGSSMELFKRADEAMYDAKKHGRDLVWVSGELKPEREGRTSLSHRKRAKPEGLTEEQCTAIRLSYFNEGYATCPVDGVKLRIESYQMFASTPHELVIECPQCGLTEQITA